MERQGTADGYRHRVAKKRLTRDEQKARTRADLLHAAERLFLRDGFSSTSLSAIAEEAGLTKGAVYSNFDSKEDLFLALLQGQAENGVGWYAPSDIEQASGATSADRAAQFGRYASGLRPSRRHIALFLEMNAAALRSDRARKWVAEYDRAFFEEVGQHLADALNLDDVDPIRLGIITQSMFVGLMMHGAFTGEDVDDDTFAAAYALLTALR